MGAAGVKKEESMETVTIPNNMRPWRCIVNGVKYEYPGGTVQTVPDEVAALIAEWERNQPPKRDPVREPVEKDYGSEEIFYIGADTEGVYRVNQAGVKKYMDEDLPELTDEQLATVAEKVQTEIGGEVEELRKDLSDVKSSLQLNTDFIDAIKVFEQKGNIFEAKTNAYEGAYYYRVGTEMIQGTNADYNCFIVPVTKNSLYTFVTSNIVLLDLNKKPILSGGSWDYEAITQCNSGDADYFAVSYRITNVPIAGYAISKGNALDYASYVGEYYAKALSESDKSTAKKVSGSISSGGSLTVSGKTAIKDGQQIAFKGKFSSFNEVNILFSGTGSTNSVTVDLTNLIINNDKNSTITEAHGLSITNGITILLEIKKSRMFVSVTSMGITFKFDCSWDQTGGTPSECVASANGMAFSDASLSVNYSAANRDIWYFGDSYAKFGTDTRLPYYIVEYGYDKNVLFNAVSGGTSTGTITALSTLVAYGNPSIAVFATGMNDGSDTDATTPATNWMNRVQQFISMCKSNNIEPVLCTVPTVPTVKNEAKNVWVRSSGYRYIDYASAVGANASGQWYTGMLSSDNVHPSTLGGNALFTQLITDLPEVMG